MTLLSANLILELPTLNLPNYEHTIKSIDGKEYIFDKIRKKNVILTPEEWVRQNFVHFLINQLNYPKSLIKIESGIGYNRLLKRSDIKVYDRNGSPFVIVECKAATVKISKDTFDQVATYNKTFQAPYMVVTNGLEHYNCKVDFVKKITLFLDEFPSFPE